MDLTYSKSFGCKLFHGFRTALMFGFIPGSFLLCTFGSYIPMALYPKYCPVSAETFALFFIWVFLISLILLGLTSLFWTITDHYEIKRKREEREKTPEYIEQQQFLKECRARFNERLQRIEQQKQTPEYIAEQERRKKLHAEIEEQHRAESQRIRLARQAERDARNEAWLRESRQRQEQNNN